MNPDTVIASHPYPVRYRTRTMNSVYLLRDINPASIDMTGVGAYAAYLMGLVFIDEQSPV